MAQRRMFSPEIVASDAFLAMPLTSQVLYFHLGMRADDDGFVNPQVIMRMIGANPDDLTFLIGKRFVLPFENGVIVVKHWRINNFVRKDRYKPTLYLDQKNQLHVKPNMAYTLDKLQGLHISEVPWKSDEETRLMGGQPTVNQRSTQDRIGKDRIYITADAVVEEKPQRTKKYPHKEEVFALWSKRPLNWNIAAPQLKAAENLYKERGVAGIKSALAFWVEHKDEPYCPDVSTPYQLDSNWSKLFKFKARNNL